MRWIGVIMVACLLFGCGSKAPLGVVESVDLDRYQGHWYEIARYPNRFEKNIVAATATYSRNEDGTIRVVNRGRKGGLDGPATEVVGKAWVIDTTTNAKLKVRFFWPFTGNYWVLDLAPDYSHVVVGEPSRKYLWILARRPTMEESTYQEILAKLPAMGYDPARLERPPQREQSF